MAGAMGSGGWAGAAEARWVASPEGDWPQFRGPRRDGICDEKGLLGAWPEGGPKRLWTAGDLGRGYSSPVVVGGRVYLTGDVGEDLHIFALDREGRRQWQSANGRSWRGDHPGARSTVTYRGGRLYHLNAHGRVACLDAGTGREVWAVDVLERFGGKNITWGLSECLLVDDSSVVVTAGGREALLVALDAADGSVRWTSPALIDAEGSGEVESASYVSPILVETAGGRWIVGCSLRHIFCADAGTGRLAWTYRKPTTYSVLAMTPVLVGDQVFMTAPHGQGGTLHAVERGAAGEGAWTTRLDACQGGVVHVDGVLYGAYYSGRKGWVAIEAATGKARYDLPDVAKGAVLWADGRLYALCEDGVMLLLEPGRDRFEVRGRFRVAEEGVRDAWAHPVIHQGRLYLRYHESLVCLDLRGS